MSLKTVIVRNSECVTRRVAVNARQVLKGICSKRDVLMIQTSGDQLDTK